MYESAILFGAGVLWNTHFFSTASALRNPGFSRRSDFCQKLSDDVFQFSSIKHGHRFCYQPCVLDNTLIPASRANSHFMNFTEAPASSQESWRLGPLKRDGSKPGRVFGFCASPKRPSILELGSQQQCWASPMVTMARSCVTESTISSQHSRFLGS